MKVNRHEWAVLLAAAGILANLLTWQIGQARKKQDREEAWQSTVEARLTRLETKMDRLLNVTTAALELADRKLPKSR